MTNSEKDKMTSNFLKVLKLKVMKKTNKIKITNSKHPEIKHSNKKRKRFNNLKSKPKTLNLSILMPKTVKMFTEKMILKA